MIKEACVESFSEAMAAQQAGANRVELCENLAVGGTTPSFGTIKHCCQELKIPVAVMIRPRGGDFCYSDAEFSIMKEDIVICRELGAEAVVFGILTPKNNIDVERTRILAELAHPMHTVFHKAFDETADPFKAIDQLINLGISRILTSGTCETAFEGKDILQKLITQANGRITIVAAGKVTSGNLETLANLISTSEFHGKRIVK